MSEFELLAQDLLEKAEAEEQLRQENDKKLLGQVLEIYDQKYVAELLRKVGKNEWSRETLNRWINGKCSPKTLTLAEEELLRKMLPEAPAHHPDYAFRFIDLFAGIGGIRKGFETIGGQCVFTSEWNKEAVRFQREGREVPEGGFQRLDAVDNQATVSLCEEYAVLKTVLSPLQLRVSAP